jgi:hypothetical protein
MSYRADTEAWEALDHFDLEFARDPMSVLHGLSTDDFQPHSEASSPYSCWPVFVMPYNLPPNKCLKQGFIFLVFVIPCPNESRKQMNIFLCLLMEEMKKLWQGVDAYGSHLKCDSTYVLLIYGQSMIIWHMTNLPVGVSSVD